MKIIYAVGALALVSGVAIGAQVRDWHDLDKTHDHVVEAIHEMDRARAANHYDMDGHGEKAERALHEAEHELQLAIESAKGH